MSWQWFPQTYWCFLSSVSAGGPCVLDWSVSLLYLIYTHTHVCCCNASWEFGSHCDGAWALASIACVEAYAFDFEQLRVFEYVGEGTK